jgi:hypothetical protein
VIFIPLLLSGGAEYGFHPITGYNEVTVELDMLPAQIPLTLAHLSPTPPTQAKERQALLLRAVLPKYSSKKLLCNREKVRCALVIPHHL